jgi:hypothetical protein
MCLEIMPSWCRQVEWGNCGIPWVNYAVLRVIDDWKGQLWRLRSCLSKLRSLLSFPSGMTSHSKSVQFNWECIGRLTRNTGEPLIICFIKCITRQQRQVWKRRILYLTHKAVWLYSISIKCAVSNQYSGEREWAIKHVVVARFEVKLSGILKTRSGPEFGDWHIKRITNS